MARRTGRKIEHVFLFFACPRKLWKPFCIDNDMTSRTGHLPFTRSFKRLADRLTEFEERRSRFAMRITDRQSICALEANKDHVGKT